MMIVGASPVSAQNLQLFFYDYRAGTEPPVGYADSPLDKGSKILPPLIRGVAN